MACLNEADTIETCIRKAQTAMREHKIGGEVIVADNGSTDGSSQIAKRMGARVVHVPEKGYGNALMGGVAAAQAELIVMGDADDSYDFLEIPKFVESLRQGYDLVVGCRLPAGGGTVLPGAMPLLHRWLGNPLFSYMSRKMFSAPIHDIYCGLRGFTRSHYKRLDLRCTGMEFATEMVIKSSMFGARIAEVPITLRRDGRKTHAPHLKTFADGWRTLRFFMLYSPKWLYLVPGALLILLGFLGYALALPGYTVLGATLGAHTLLCSSLAIMMGFQAVVFALLAKVFAIGEHLLPEDRRVTKFFRVATLERGLLLSAVMFLGGLVLLAAAVYQWWRAGFGSLDYAATMRLVIPGVTMSALAFQGFLSSCFVSILGLRRK
jgi:glycosyltransferase involved in cell wall biosynthesis